METATGINVRPGSDDDGWISPPPVPLSDGTTIYLYKDGEALRAAYDAIENAKKLICLEVYIFRSDDTGRAFAELLCKKASQGLRVYLIYDSFGCYDTDSEMFESMRRAGVRVQEFNPIWPWNCEFSWRPANRDHRKLLVIDNEIAGLGGLNIGDEYAGAWVTPTRDKSELDFWRDSAIGLRGPAAHLFLRCFAKTWHYVTHGGRIQTAEFNYGVDKLIHTGDCEELSILASVATMNSPLRPMLHRLLHQAESSIQMTMAYFAPDDDLVAEICGAARRGVKVQLVLPARSDVPIFVIAARAYYEKLMSVGVQIFERQAVVLHAKSLVIDGRLGVIGSVNLDYRSIEYNLELSAIIRCEQFARQMQALFENDIGFSNRISLSAWRRRPTSDRLVQWAVSRARYLF